MRQSRQLALLVVVAAVLAVGAAACGVEKSENPTSPSVAGPIAGVSITTPALVDPPPGKRFELSELPVKLTIQNSATNGQRPVNYIFEVATDNGFTSKLVTSSGVPPGPEGRTVYTLLDKPLEAGKTYYWRAQADDGANRSEPADPRTFAVYTLSISVPGLLSPANGQKFAFTEQPVALTIQNSTTNGERPLSFIFEVAIDPAFGSKVYSNGPGGAPAGENGQTRIVLNKQLEGGRTYYWRAQAVDGVSQSQTSGSRSFSVASVAETPQPPAPSPGPAPSAGDAIDLRTATWSVGANASGWAVTSQMTNAYYSNGTLCTEHTKLGQWPKLPFFGDPNTLVEGNQVVLAKIGGKWYAGSGEWLRPGQACKSVPREIGPDTFYNGPPPLNSWIPQPGEWYGLMVTTPSRAGQWGTAERSNVVLVQWK
jgi:hypothetical protein